MTAMELVNELIGKGYGFVALAKELHYIGFTTADLKKQLILSENYDDFEIIREVYNEYVKLYDKTAPTLEYLHTSLAIGYQSTKYDIISLYSGKFGNGYTIETHTYKSTRYHNISYYIYKEQ